ncbi:MAG: hypothetical protein QNJ97_07460 [Myxococcota bacterium]|nr:hypothetical protein [Myxococcota bacterium]
MNINNSQLIMRYHKSVCILGNESLFDNQMKRYLEQVGFTRVHIATTWSSIMEYLQRGNPGLIVVNVEAGEVNNICLELLLQLRMIGFRAPALAVSNHPPSASLLLRTVKCDIIDFIVKSIYINFIEEIDQLTDSLFDVMPYSINGGPINNLVYLRSLGLGKLEIELLNVFAVSFEPYRKLAEKLGISVASVKKRISTILEKMELINRNCLIEHLTICKFINRGRFN